MTLYEKRILRVLEYIHDNPAGDLSLDQLADVAAMSRFHWHRVFHGMTGETCAQAVRRVRLHRAACWLVQKDWSIGEIAKKVGYPNVQSFTRAFRDGFGVSPGVFRKRGVIGAPPKLTPLEREKMFEVNVEQVEARRLAATPHKGPYIEIGGAFEKISAIAGLRGLWPQVEGMVGVYYDDPNAVAEADLRSHAGLQISAAAAMPEGLEEVQLPAGKHAVLLFKGPYAGLRSAYDYMFGEWVPKAAHELAHSPSYEVYLNSPADTAPEELLTQICVPLV
ncbi:AraC family transcriptional regulator [Cochlodiniinecator piscidefendens]|uniref:AraC family transcriptional regulator n=1 Tax=Cochlodiniinecator piscidefendens TaxID=2715756 RepID=UPI00140C8B4D|nr:AraC family transcriptional regulator [Cochlodiniinecator piscidefendens]